MWFEDLTGFREADAEQVRANLDVRGDRLISRVNGKGHGCGRLAIPSLAELRAHPSVADSGPVRLREVVANVQALHRDPANAGALFQAASQFNLLEMTGPNVTPERGVGGYENDHTQGPACAIACGAGTIYRNYFVPVGDDIGQTADRQVDCLADVGDALGNGEGSLWEMRNGYALMTEAGLPAVADNLARLDAAERDDLGALLRIGVQHDVEVTLSGGGHHVTQVYGAALPVAYGRGSQSDWEGFARLVLDASYEATMLAAMVNANATGNRTVFLTLLGGGVFGNAEEWILGAIERSLNAVGDADLDVAIVSYGRSKRGVREFAEGWAG
jgi:hypothetical protein